MNNLDAIPRLCRVLLGILGSSLLLSGCGGKPAGPGLCNLTCSNARLATRLRIVPVTKDVNLTCGAAGQKAKVPLIWKTIWKEEAGTATASTSTSLAETTVASGERAMANVSIDPVFGGNIASLTPSSDYCSDQCGLVKLEFEVTCYEGSASIDIHSGPTFSESPITITTKIATTTP
jgi:hypothetical protein